MSRWLLLLLALAACTDREVSLRIHTPAECNGGVPDASPPECPLAPVAGVRTVLQRADGSIAFDRCERVQDALCTYEDLSGFVFIDGVPPSDGIEIRIEGSAEADCGLPTVFRCDSFGDNVVDLRRTGVVVPMWCQCPRAIGP